MRKTTVCFGNRHGIYDTTTYGRETEMKKNIGDTYRPMLNVKVSVEASLSLSLSLSLYIYIYIYIYIYTIHLYALINVHSVD